MRIPRDFPKKAVNTLEIFRLERSDSPRQSWCRSIRWILPSTGATAFPALRLRWSSGV